MKKKIIIVRPRRYGGGTLVLWKLCELLRNKGYDAKIFYILDEPQKETNMLKWWLKWACMSLKDILIPYFLKFFSWTKFKLISRMENFMQKSEPRMKTKRLPFFNKNKTIVLYPEKIYGNPLHAKNVVRWLLYYNPFKGDPDAYGRDDLVIAYREVFNDWSLNPKGHFVKTQTFDAQLYHQYNFNKRSGNCYIIRKGRDRKDLPHSFDGPIIDDLSEKEKVRVFNECKYCYSYDLQTFYTSIASICGCIPIVVLEPGKTKYDYYTKEEADRMYGHAFSTNPDEIEYAKKTSGKLMQSLDFSKSNKENVTHFIKIIKNKFQ